MFFLNKFKRWFNVSIVGSLDAYWLFFTISLDIVDQSLDDCS